LLKELVELKLWNDDMKNQIIANNGMSSYGFIAAVALTADSGSIQNISTIPDNVKAIYKTVWEISQKKVLDLAADRGAYICQSQSLNVHLSSPSLGQLVSLISGVHSRRMLRCGLLDKHALLRMEEGS